MGVSLPNALRGSQIDSKRQKNVGSIKPFVRAKHSPVMPLSVSEKMTPLASRSDFQKSSKTIRREIREAEIRYKIPRGQLDRVVKCESNYRQSARGAAGEIGAAQFLPSSWQYFQNLSGKHHLSIHSASDQIELAAWAFANGYQHHWTCYKKLYVW